MLQEEVRTVLLLLDSWQQQHEVQHAGLGLPKLLLVNERYRHACGVAETTFVVLQGPETGADCCRNWGQQLPKPQVLRSISQMGAEKYRELGVSPMLEMSL